MSARAKILNGASLSGEIDLRNQRLLGIIYPAVWTAADLSLQVGDVSGGTFGEVFTDPGSGVGTALALDGAAGQATFLSTAIIIGNCFIKIRSGPSGVPVNQGGDRDIIILTIPISH
jgi:hypothetical protein